MGDIDHIAVAGTKLKWSDEVVSVNEVEEKYGYPQIVKITDDTAATYNLPENEPVLLVCKKKLIRMIAQTLEEGHYVIGRQLEIPDEFSGLFKITSDYQRDEDESLKTFRSVQEIADAFPSKVYLQEQLTVTLVSDESAGKFTTIVLQKGDELTIVSRSDSATGSGLLGKPASRFISKVRRSQQSFLVVHWTRLNENLSLPLSIQGWFATRPPLMVHLLDSGGVISLQQIMEKANFPLSVVVATNSSRSVKDDFVLRSGMHLKLIGLEEHNIVLGIRPSQQIVEFSPDTLSVLLPLSLASMSSTAWETEKDEILEKNLYQTYVQGAYLNSKLQGSASNVDEYCTSVRYYIPRNKRPTIPKPLDGNACARQLSPLHKKKSKTSNQGISAIQLFASSSQPDNTMSHGMRSGRRATSLRRQLPTPTASELVSSGNPPLPPRNNVTAPPLPPANYDPSVLSIPPVPPKSRTTSSSASQLQFSVASSYINRPVPSPPPLSSLPPDIPRRPAPVPNVNDFMMNTSFSSTSNDVNENNQDQFESIWEEYKPRPRSPSSDLKEEFKSSDPFNVKSEGNQMLPLGSNDNFGVPVFKNTLNEVRSDSPCFSLDQPKFEFALTEKNDPQIYENVSLKFQDQEQDLPDNAESANLQVPLTNGQTLEAETHVSTEDIHAPPSPTARKISTEEAVLNAHVINVAEPLVNGLNLPDEVGSRSCTSEEVPSTLSRRHSFSTAKVYMSSPTNWCPPDDVNEMTVDELCHSLRYIGLSEDVVRLFYNERIDGPFLQELTEDILIEDFHLSKLYRFKLKRFINGWRPKLTRE